MSCLLKVRVNDQVDLQFILMMLIGIKFNVMIRGRIIKTFSNNLLARTAFSS